MVRASNSRGSSSFGPYLSFTYFTVTLTYLLHILLLRYTSAIFWWVFTFTNLQLIFYSYLQYNLLVGILLLRNISAVRCSPKQGFKYIYPQAPAYSQTVWEGVMEWEVYIWGSFESLRIMNQNLRYFGSS